MNSASVNFGACFACVADMHCFFDKQGQPHVYRHCGGATESAKLSRLFPVLSWLYRYFLVCTSELCLCCYCYNGFVFHAVKVVNKSLLQICKMIRLVTMFCCILIKGNF